MRFWKTQQKKVEEVPLQLILQSPCDDYGRYGRLLWDGLCQAVVQTFLAWHLFCGREVTPKFQLDLSQKEKGESKYTLVISVFSSRRRCWGSPEDQLLRPDNRRQVTTIVYYKNKKNAHFKSKIHSVTSDEDISKIWTRKFADAPPQMISSRKCTRASSRIWPRHPRLSLSTRFHLSPLTMNRVYLLLISHSHLDRFQSRK